MQVDAGLRTDRRQRLARRRRDAVQAEGRVEVERPVLADRAREDGLRGFLRVLGQAWVLGPSAARLDARREVPASASEADRPVGLDAKRCGLGLPRLVEARRRAEVA